MLIEVKEGDFDLLSELIRLIEEAKVKVVVHANSSMTVLF